MPPRLRSALVLLVLALAGCAPAQRPAPAASTGAAPEAVAAREAAGLRAGPMLGYATHREAGVWVQTSGPAEVQLRYTPAGRDSAVVTPALRTSAEGDHIAQFEVFGLEPGRRYTYDVLIDGRPVALPYETAFETQPLWQWRTEPPDFTAAFGSCLYVNDPAYDRPGQPYGGGFEILDAIVEKDPDLMLWLGDNVYLREVDWWTEQGFRYRYGHTRAFGPLQPLLANQPNVATWDDHDYGPNNADRSYVLKDVALETFRSYWMNPSYGLPGTPGVFTHVQWADVDFFLLDDRFHRSPEHAPPTEEKAILGEAQLEWLLDALTASSAPFKIVVNGGQILNPFDFYETHAQAPHERQRLLDGIAERRIEGVVFLSGDRHHTELLRLDRDGLYPLYDFTSSPLTAGPGNPTRELDNPLRVPGTLVAGQRSFGTLSFSGPRTDRVLTMRAFDTAGALLWEHTVRASDLRAPREE